MQVIINILKNGYEAIDQGQMSIESDGVGCGTTVSIRFKLPEQTIGHAGSGVDANSIPAHGVLS